MKLTKLFGEPESDGRRAVSPVIGVILMVAITVILAAVIGTFVLNLGDSVESAPQATFDFDAEGEPVTNITITHNGGDTIEADRLNVSGAANNGTDGDIAFTDTDAFDSGDTVSAGDQVEINTTNYTIDGAKGDTVRIVYTAEGGGSSNIIATYDLPAAGGDN